MGRHKVVVGLGFGDEGKGTIVDYLTYKDDYDFVVRFSGGPQAAHNVITEDGRHHTFSQFGSGTFNGVPTILTRHMLVNPLNLANEAEALAAKVKFDPYSKLIISENSLLVTPWHAAANQLSEIRRGDGRHGSCGQGVGVAQKFALDYPDLALRVKDLLLDYDSFVAKGHIVHQLLKAEYGSPSKEERTQMPSQMRNEFVQRTPGNLHNMYQYFLKDHNPLILPDEEITALIADSNCVWEGSQGALLDEWKGFHPYTTWSTTTAHTALQMLSEAAVDREDVEVIGVTRTYHTRHGAGPFPSEDEYLTDQFPEPHNTTGVFQGGWRVGAWDLSLLEYGIAVNEKVDSLAITHCDADRLYTTWSFSRPVIDYSGDLEQQARLTELAMTRTTPSVKEHYDKLSVYNTVSKALGVPISVLSYGPKAVDKLEVDSNFFSMVQ